MEQRFKNTNNENPHSLKSDHLPPGIHHLIPDEGEEKSGWWTGWWTRTPAKRLRKLGSEENNSPLLKLNQSFGSITDAVKLTHLVWVRYSSSYISCSYITLQNMIIPIRCFSCGKVIGNKWEAYLGLLQVSSAIFLQCKITFLVFQAQTPNWV